MKDVGREDAKQVKEESVVMPRRDSHAKCRPGEARDAQPYRRSSRVPRSATVFQGLRPPHLVGTFTITIHVTRKGHYAPNSCIDDLILVSNMDIWKH
jgi:hypothetical protein